MYINPYSDLINSEGQWLKSNFHTHAGTGPGTCGVYSLEDVISAYRDAKYNVLTISNHDLYTDTEKLASESGEEMVMINGFEYSQGKHMLCIGGTDIIFDEHQKTIDECKRQGGFVILCHPNWQYKEYWSRNEIDTISGYTGIEIYNGVIFRLSGTGLATDTWDYLLSQGKLVWGFGNDDFHRWHDLARTNTMIFAKSRDRASILKSIHSGCFYVSTGLRLKSFNLTDEVIRISVSANSYVSKYRFTFTGKNGDVLSDSYGEYGEYKVSDEPYVRVKVMSEHGAALWTQPVYREDLFSRA